MFAAIRRASSLVSSLAAYRRPDSTLAHGGRKSERGGKSPALSNPFLTRRLYEADKSTIAVKPVVGRRCEGRIGMDICVAISFYKERPPEGAAGHVIQFSLGDFGDSARFICHEIAPAFSCRSADFLSNR